MMAAGAPLGGGDNSANELTQLVQQMLTQMQQRFQTMSDNIIGRIDEMGNRIDDLEKSIADLVQEAQSEGDQAANQMAQHQQQKPVGQR
jgi:heat shock factor-binding protein 1